MAASAPAFSIVIPAYHEARRLPATLRALADFTGLGMDLWEVLIVVEPSRDGTLELAERFAAGQANFRVVGNRVHRGKGYAVRTGMLEARGGIIFYMDADLSVPLGEIEEFLRYFDEHPEVAVIAGNRQHALSRVTRQQGRMRQRMGVAFNQILRALGPTALRDTQCGFKAFRREAAREIFARARVDGFAFDVEVLLLAEGLGYRVADLPVEWINSPESHVRIVRDSARMLLDALRIRRLVARTLRERPAC